MIFVATSVRQCKESRIKCVCSVKGRISIRLLKLDVWDGWFEAKIIKTIYLKGVLQ